MNRYRHSLMVTTSFLYSVGGSLLWNDPSYIVRAADQLLHDAITQRQFAYVLGARQVGKSSLRVQARHRLIQQGYQCVTIQANQLNDALPSGPQSPDLSASAQSNASSNLPSLPSSNAWCAGLVSTVYSEIKPTDLGSLRRWLKSTASLPSSLRLSKFVDDLLKDTLLAGPLVIFIDEIDALLASPFTAELFDWIARCYDLRKENPLYNNLTFVVLGSAIAADLPQPGNLFRLGREVSLPPFQLMETYRFNQGFEEKIEDSTMLLKAIYKWTYGQPFLTQKLCQLMSDTIDRLIQASHKPMALSPKTIGQWVDDTVRSHILKDWQTKDEPIHLRAIGDRINRSFNKKALLQLYKTLLTDRVVLADGSYTQAELVLSGLVIEQDGYIQVANEIYRHVFVLK